MCTHVVDTSLHQAIDRSRRHHTMQFAYMSHRSLLVVLWKTLRKWFPVSHQMPPSLSIRTGPPLGMPSRYHDTWSRQSPSWYQKDGKSSQTSGDKTPEGYGEWSDWDTWRSTAETGQPSSCGRKHKKIRLGRRPGRNSSVSLRRISGDCRRSRTVKKGCLSQT